MSAASSKTKKRPNLNWLIKMADENKDNQVSLSELRQSPSPFSSFFKKHLGFLFNPQSLFYYGLFIFVVGILWCVYALFTNSGTTLYNWDYNSQYVTMTYDFWDTWHDFFKTGKFLLYDTTTYLGSDNIGSNSYYGLFDPFLFICYIFPRSWIPQTFTFATFFKAMASAFAMRAYLKYMKVSEWSSRLGGLIFAYSGFVNFFVGFPSFVSMACCVPLVMLGIEKVLKEKKITCLVFSLFLLGIISFFFLVVICIWGVIYAIWRYFWTLKDRHWKDNLLVIGIGVLSFAIGIAMSAWTLLPSIRETSLSGRSISVGRAYLNSLAKAFSSQDIGSIFSMLFEPVGSSTGRELGGLISFFFPTCNYTYLPLAGSTGLITDVGTKYDAWTSSLFCYTPMVIMFFTALISSIRRKEWQPLVAIPLCCYLLFTTFAYYFFFAFAGDGYGRWFIVLVPLIILYGTKELDRLKDEPKWVLPTGSFLAVILTAVTVLLCYYLLQGKKFDSVGTYFITSYNVPAVVYDSNKIAHSLLWLIFYQMALVLIESMVIIYFQKRPSLSKILMGFVTLEIVVAGNISFAYGALWNYQSWFLGGVSTSEKLTGVFSNIDEYDPDSYYRSYTDSYPNTNSSMAFGFNGSGFFHSLYNYSTASLSHQSHIVGDDRVYTRYDESIHAPSWSGWYGNKRYGLDTAFGMKYYVIANEGYSDFSYQKANVPFGSVEVPSLSTSSYRVYENKNAVALGHGVDTLYQENKKDNSNNSDFYGTYSWSSGSKSSAIEMLKNEEVYLNGAIINDDEVEKLPDSFHISESPECSLSSTQLSYVAFSGKYMTTSYGYEDTNAQTNYSPTYFLDHLDDSSIVTSTPVEQTSGSILNQYGKQVYYPYGNWGGYFNYDPDGAYFVITIPKLDEKAYRAPIITFIGDTFEEDGTTVKDENVVLSYEYSSLNNWHNLERTCDSTSKTFGFYPEGRVKYIMMSFKSNGSNKTSSLETPVIYYCERSVIDTENKKLQSQEYALTDVTYDTDVFTCKSDFSTSKMVVTTIGYDEGWKVTAVDENGESSQLETYNLDGGFVGFIAPSGSTSYTLRYETPYLKSGVILSMGGTAIYVIYEIGWFYLETKKLRKERGLVYVRKNRKNKKEKDNPNAI
ncbi:MAG: YfhO family protein [Bacilli bacterium]|nr:YfhO family protein [Bacilli bacterium]